MGNPKNPSQNSSRSSSSGAGSGAGTGGEDLHSAARSGDLIAVQSILNSNPLSVNSRDKHSRTPLHLAAWSGHAQVVSYLCTQKADVGAAAMDDMGAIHFAAQKGHLEVVRSLVSFGVSVKASTRKGFTPLHFATQGSHLELIKYLVRKGSNLSAKTKAGKTPLDLTSSEEIRSFLIEFERSSKKGDELNVKEKAEEPDQKQELEEKTENGDSEVAAAIQDEEVVAAIHDEEKENEQAKRKGDEDTINESTSEPKKAKVALNHLLTADDGQEDDENL